VENRFRKLPPRIQPVYETEPVSDPPPLPEVRETSWLSPAGQVAAYEQLAEAVSRPAQRGWRRGVVVAWAAAVLLVGLLAVLVGWWGSF
jgi:hypothetical protein